MNTVLDGATKLIGECHLQTEIAFKNVCVVVEQANGDGRCKSKC